MQNRIPTGPIFTAAVVTVIPRAAPIQNRKAQTAAVPSTVRPVSHRMVKTDIRAFSVYQNSSSEANSTCWYLEKK